MIRQRTHKNLSSSHRNLLPQIPEHKTQNAAEIYSQLFNSSSDPILILSSGLQIEYANAAADKFFNFSPAHAKNRYFKDCVTAESLHRVNAALKEVRRKISQIRIELDAIDSHRQRVTLEVAIFPVLDGKNITGYWLVLRDVSQQRQIEELVRESEKMEAIQYLVSGTTKELQHPLLAILKRIQSIESKYDGRSFEYVSFKEFTYIMDFLKVISKQIKNCYDTTAKLTSLNKKRLKFESNYCQSNAVIREVARLKEQNFKNSNVNLKLRLFDKLHAVGLGELELSQIIGHIVDNALQAMPAGGHLTIVTSNLSDSHQVKIEISDEGVGISPEDLPHIFEPFFTTKQRGVDRSVGLGLSIVYSLVKAAHGEIHVKSSLRKGTSVQLIFPVAIHGKMPHHSRK